MTQTLSQIERTDIDNGIWLCQNDAKRVDTDAVTYTVEGLRETRRSHERTIATSVGLPVSLQEAIASASSVDGDNGMKAREYAFLDLSTATNAYKEFIAPILEDRGVRDGSVLGVLMCTASARERAREPNWTMFVDPEWLRWQLAGQNAGYESAPTIAKKHIYGSVPGWPDEFEELLHAIVLADVTFQWQRHEAGYLRLAQQRPPSDSEG